MELGHGYDSVSAELPPSTNKERANVFGPMSPLRHAALIVALSAQAACNPTEPAEDTDNSATTGGSTAAEVGLESDSATGSSSGPGADSTTGEPTPPVTCKPGEKMGPAGATDMYPARETSRSTSARRPATTPRSADR